MRPRVKNVALVSAIAKSGKTGKELSSLAGIHQCTLSQIINGKVKPKPETMKAISLVIGCKPDELMEVLP